MATIGWWGTLAAGGRTVSIFEFDSADVVIVGTGRCGVEALAACGSDGPTLLTLLDVTWESERLPLLTLDQFDAHSEIERLEQFRDRRVFLAGGVPIRGKTGVNVTSALAAFQALSSPIVRIHPKTLEMVCDEAGLRVCSLHDVTKPQTYQAVTMPWEFRRALHVALEEKEPEALSVVARDIFDTRDDSALDVRSCWVEGLPTLIISRLVTHDAGRAPYDGKFATAFLDAELVGQSSARGFRWIILRDDVLMLDAGEIAARAEQIKIGTF